MTDATRSIAAAVACPWTFSRSARSSATLSEILHEFSSSDGWDAVKAIADLAASESDR